MQDAEVVLADLADSLAVESGPLLILRNENVEVVDELIGAPLSAPKVVDVVRPCQLVLISGANRDIVYCRGAARQVGGPVGLLATSELGIDFLRSQVI